MKRIKDPVHGYIPVRDDFVKYIIDTPHFQRLRHLKQLSATYMVYPSANHTRFEHSLGVYHLAEQAFAGLRESDNFCEDMSEEELDEIETTLLAASLLHDIGHPPFSHLGEPLLNREEIIGYLDELEERLDAENVRSGLNAKDPIENKDNHELLGCAIILSEYSEPLRNDIEIDPVEVCCYILGLSLQAAAGEGWQHTVASDILSSAMDVDRLDYIKRDNMMTGADVLNVDTDRMVDSYTTCNESLTFSDKALSTISNYLEGRIAVYMWVTQHHKSVYANRLLREMLEELDRAEDGELFTVSNVIEKYLSDDDVMHLLKQHYSSDEHPRLTELYRRFASRDFESSCWKHKMAYKTILGPNVAREFDEKVDSVGTEQIEEVLQEEFEEQMNSEDSEIWVERSYVPSYQPSELRDITLAYEGEEQSVVDFGLYQEREYLGPTPYIFAPDEVAPDIIGEIQDQFS
jgi:HD superfamily phosphohydrolase